MGQNSLKIAKRTSIIEWGIVQDKIKCLAVIAAVKFETFSHSNCAVFNSTFIFAYCLEPDIFF